MSLWIGRGSIFHSRLEHEKNSFRYPSFFLLFLCSEHKQLASQFKKQFWRILSLKSEDYLNGQSGELDTAIKSFLKERCGFEAGEVWLHTLPRMFGYAFNPVSFWFCKRNQSVEAVLVEVNNTFGERHFYWIKPENGIQSSEWYQAQKVFHVSPFFPVDGFYKFRFQLNPTDTRIDINYHAEDGKLRLATWVQGAHSEIRQVSLTSLLFSYGWMTPMVIIRIHFQAIILWIKKIQFYKKPKPPTQEITS